MVLDADLAGAHRRGGSRPTGRRQHGLPLRGRVPRLPRRRLMPTYESIAAFQRQWEKLDAQERQAFKRALALFIIGLQTGTFAPELRLHKLVNTEIWSITWAKDGRALFRYGSQITAG